MTEWEIISLINFIHVLNDTLNLTNNSVNSVLCVVSVLVFISKSRTKKVDKTISEDVDQFLKGNLEFVYFLTKTFGYALHPRYNNVCVYTCLCLSHPTT